MEQSMDPTASQAFIWHELMSRDPDSSERFYESVAGLRVQRLGDGPGAYRMLLAGDRPVGGLTGPRPDSDVWPSGGPAGHWVGYLASDDVDAAARRAEELGGSVLLGPLDVPGTGRVAVLRDPDGATFGLFRPAPIG
jgi:predicted enzyme related to lactoylglutathione lyase